MADRSTDTQSFSGFVALNRADLTHEPARRGWPSVAKIVIAALVLAVTVFLLVR